MDIAMQICFVLYSLELDFYVDTISCLDVYLFSLSCCQLSIFLANESNFISLHLLAPGLNTDKEFNTLFLEETDLQRRECKSAI